MRLREVLVAGASNVRYRRGASMTSLSEHTDREHVRFTDSSTGVFDLVVGVDGIRSAVRSLAMEDAVVLAEELRTQPTVGQALIAYTHHRTPRIAWVQDQSRALAASLNAAPAIRDRALRQHGSDTFTRRSAPGIPVP
jgi:2-polyprenyl-6-methoxyphenol hydroxylase-like FAD-dependent oxidoreductase